VWRMMSEQVSSNCHPGTREVLQKRSDLLQRGLQERCKRVDVEEI
jgi:hypothetical protein